MFLKSVFYFFLMFLLGWQVWGDNPSYLKKLLRPAFLLKSKYLDSAQTKKLSLYVAPDGSDFNLGTQDAPLKTLQVALEMAQAGTQIFMRAGVYHEAVQVKSSGNPQEGYITIQNYPGEKAILDGSDLEVGPGYAALILIENQSYIKIQGLELRNFQTEKIHLVPAGIRVVSSQGEVKHVEIRRNRIHAIKTHHQGQHGGNASGIAISGISDEGLHDLLIQGNEMYDLRLGSSEALVLSGNVYNFLIENNQIHHCNNIAIDIAGFYQMARSDHLDRARDGIVRDNYIHHISSVGNPAYGENVAAAGGIYVDGGKNVIIEQNHVAHVDIGIEIASERPGKNAELVLVRNNLIRHSNFVGLGIGGYATHLGIAKNCAIVHNTFYHNNDDHNGTGELLMQYSNQNNIIMNNIFYAHENGVFINQVDASAESFGNVIDGNLYYSPLWDIYTVWAIAGKLYYGFAHYQKSTGHDLSGLYANPQFKYLKENSAKKTSMSREEFDFSLGPNSPAIDHALPLNSIDLGRDYLGKNRLNGPAADIGAIEYAAPSAARSARAK